MEIDNKNKFIAETPPEYFQATTGHLQPQPNIVVTPQNINQPQQHYAEAPPDYFQATAGHLQQQPSIAVTPLKQNNYQSQKFLGINMGNVPFEKPNNANGIFTQQPEPVITQYLPDNYSAFAWLTCLFCCWPLGLVSIIKSNEVNTAISVGDIQRAQIASKSAQNFAIASLVGGIVVITLIIVIFLVFR